MSDNFNFFSYENNVFKKHDTLRTTGLTGFITIVSGMLGM